MEICEKPKVIHKIKTVKGKMFQFLFYNNQASKQFLKKVITVKNSFKILSNQHGQNNFVHRDYYNMTKKTTNTTGFYNS